VSPDVGERAYRSKHAEYADDEKHDRQDSYIEERVRAWMVRPNSEIPEGPAAKDHRGNACYSKCDSTSSHKSTGSVMVRFP
jgi:hypothetical protein